MKSSKIKKKLTKKEIKSWMEQNFKDLKAKFNLQGWRVEVFIKNKNEGNEELYAEVNSVLPQYKKADLTLYSDFLDTKEILRDTIEHELIHLVLSPLNSANEEALENLQYDELKKIHSKAFTYQEEIVLRHVEELLIKWGVS